MGTEDGQGNDQPGTIGRVARDTCQAVSDELEGKTPPHESALGSFIIYGGAFAIVCGLIFGMAGSEPVGCILAIAIGVVLIGVGQMLRLLQRIWRHVWIQTQTLESSKNPVLHQGKQDGTGPGQHNAADD